MTDPYISPPGPWGFISDVHGNPYGLAACLDVMKARGVRTTFFLGDAVGYLPLESKVLDQLKAVGACCLLGNHDAMLVGRLPVGRGEEVYRVESARGRLDRGAVDRMASWPLQQRLQAGADLAISVRMVHGGPDDPLEQYVYADTPVMAEKAECDILICGHTHRPFVRRLDGLTIVNVGSAGLPRDTGNLASCAIMDPELAEIEIIRAPFDVDLLLEAARSVQPPHPAVISVLRRRSSR